MTLPSSSFPRLDSVAVRTPDNTLVSRNLGFHCGDGLELRDVRSLPDHVVNIERHRVSVVSTVDASALGFEVRDPFFDTASTSIIDAIHSLPVAGLLKSAFAPCPALFCSRRLSGRPGTARTKRRAVLGIGSLRREHVTAMRTRPVSSWRIFPGRHTSMIADRGFANPCKPDIFEATYERAGVRGE